MGGKFARVTSMSAVRVPSLARGAIIWSTSKVAIAERGREMTLAVGHLHLKTTDPKKSAQWWADNLGARIVGRSDAGDKFKLDLDGVPISITGFAPDQTRRQRFGLEHIAMVTDDVGDVVEKLKASGACLLEMTRGRSGEANYFFETPEGFQIEIMST
jgi:catechol 2,3-dioxygenase-like lactoylglutathione lyase family enzyme